MDSGIATFFITTIGLGSSLLLALSSKSPDGTIDVFAENGTYQMEILVVNMLALTYFVVDFLMMILYYKPSYRVYFIHHLIGISSVALVYNGYYELVKYLLAYLTYELSTIFLNISKSYYRIGCKSAIYHAATIGLKISFFVVRILFGSWLTIRFVYQMSEAPYPEWLVMVFPVSLQLMNYWWFISVTLLN